MSRPSSTLGFHEKILYGQLVLLIVVFFFYAHFIRNAAPGTYSVRTIPLFAAFLFACYTSWYRRKSGNTVSDERDAMIEGIGATWSNLVLSIGVGSILIMFWEHGRPDNVRHLVDILCHLLGLSIAVRIIRQLVAYRSVL
jgi:drug/metabolite transporter (DMT)-like permease